MSVDREWTYIERGSKWLGYDLVGPEPGDRGAFANEDEVRLAAAAPKLLKSCQRLLVLARLLTVRQVIEAGDDAIKAAGLNPWCLNEGLARGDERISVDFAEVAIRDASGPLSEE